MQDKLDPVELGLKLEGEHLLDLIKSQQKPSSGLVGSDGVPLNEDLSKVSMNEAALREAIEINAQKQSLNDMKALKEIIEKDPKANKVHQVAFAAHKLLMWSKMELSTNPDITDDMIHLLDGMIMRAVYDDLKGFDVVQLKNQIRHGVLKIMEDFIREYQDKGRERGMQLKNIKKRLGNEGISLPGTKIKERLGKPFTPGQMIVLYGEKHNTSLALDIISEKHTSKDDGIVFRLASAGGEKAFSSIVMPASGWTNSAKSISSLNKTLEPVLRKDCLLLLVDDLDTLYCVDEKIADRSIRRSYAIKRLYQWCVENLVAVVIAEEDPNSPSGKNYGLIQGFRVTEGKSKSFVKIEDEEISYPEPYQGN